MFTKWKEQRLTATDLSKKGSVDSPIVDIVDFINTLDDFFTTSSCSGRIVLFSEDSSITGGPVKKGCDWLFVSHGLVDLEEMVTSLAGKTGNIVLKFEAFVLHVQCRSLENAQLVHKTAVASGHRNSGITVGKNGKIIAAVRSTHGLEVPLSENGRMFADREYLSFLVKTANAKMKENLKRIERFEKCFKEEVLSTRGQLSGADSSRTGRERSRMPQKSPCKATQTEFQKAESNDTSKEGDHSQSEVLFDGFNLLEDVT